MTYVGLKQGSQGVEQESQLVKQPPIVQAALRKAHDTSPICARTEVVDPQEHPVRPATSDRQSCSNCQQARSGRQG